MTDLFGIPYAEVIGDPIHQSKSPIIHNFWLAKLGIKAEYRATRVRADALARHLDARRGDLHWRGCNVTIPHKQTALGLVDSCLRTAERVGAVNCIHRSAKRLVGENSDVDGVNESLDVTRLERDPGIVCLIGAGGGARAALYALGAAGAREVRILVRKPERAADLLATFELAATSI